MTDLEPVHPEFAAAMVLLASACAAKLTEARVRTYWGLLRDVPVPDLQRGIYRCARERDSRFQPADLEARLPSVAEILSYIVTPTADAAVLAWNSLQQAVPRVGSYQSLVVLDGCAAEALLRTFGSWERFCEADEGPALAMKRQEFLAAYKDARRYPPTAQRLAGRCERGGRYVTAPNVFVGLLERDGSLAMLRDGPQLAAGVLHGHDRPALAEAGEAEADQGSQAPAGGAGRAGSPPAGGHT